MSAVREPSPLKQILDQQGVRGALEFLNERVPHRLTAIYQLRGPVVHCTDVVDKLGELTSDLMAIVPLGESFCQFAMRDGVFLTDDTVADSRLDGNPNQGVVVCYHGLPVLDDSAALFGTLCHFDFVPRELPEGEFEYLQVAARQIGGYVSR